jgi:uncharacterized membrane protein
MSKPNEKNDSKESTEPSKDPHALDWMGKLGLSILVFFPVFVIVISVVALHYSIIDPLTVLALFGGSLLIVCGYFHLVYVLPRLSKDVEASVSMQALRASFWLVMFGLIIIVLAIVLGYLVRLDLLSL